jgi:hypothetical protein
VAIAAASRRGLQRPDRAPARRRGDRGPTSQPAFTGYRYTEILERFNDREQRVENWVDRDWQGRAITDGRERDFMYGDGPLLDLDITALPTEPKALLAALAANERGQNWAPGLPTDDQVRFDVTYSVLLLLGTANATRNCAARCGVRSRSAARPEALRRQDPNGRDGDAVTLPAPSQRAIPWGTGHADVGHVRR